VNQQLTNTQMKVDRLETNILKPHAFLILDYIAFYTQI